MKFLHSQAAVTHLLILIVILFCSCEKTTISPDLNHDNNQISTRSCQTVTQSWIAQLKTLASDEYSTPLLNLQVSAIERTSDSTYIYYTQNELTGRVAIDITGFLLLITDGNFEGDIVGYYNSTNLSFCTPPVNSSLLVGEIGDLVYSTLGIIGVDSDSF